MSQDELDIKQRFVNLRDETNRLKRDACNELGASKRSAVGGINSMLDQAEDLILAAHRRFVKEGEWVD